MELYINSQTENLSYIFIIPKIKIKYCTACDSCHDTEMCTIKDDYKLVLEKLLAASGIGDYGYPFGLGAANGSRPGRVLYLQAEQDSLS
jgi:hypothetical protein